MRRVLLVISVLAAACVSSQAQQGSCVTCHADTDLFDEDYVRIVRSFAEDVHAQVGLSCVDCHGGNADPALADDMDAAMDPDFAEHPYVGAPDRTGVPGFCGRCHSDPNYMRRFKPDARVDQEREYWTSHHGLALKRGDTNVATCIDCHGVHGIQRAGDPSSLVYPTNVAATCGSCHGDGEHMEGYTLPDGSPLPVDQEAKWRRSVHAAAMYDKEDLSAPTCNDCHGNHGAAPPGLESISFVCGQCHGREAEIFRGSAKHYGYLTHNALIAEEEAQACGDCHEPPDPQAKVAGIHSFSECATCHGNHGVVRPTVALLGPLPATPCAFCHEASGPLAAEVPEPQGVMQHYSEVLGDLMVEAEQKGLKDLALFDWLVDRARQLPVHTQAAPEGEARALRPEFRRLFEKFRIGKTHYTYTDPVTGEEAKSPLRRCTTCHGDNGSAGRAVAKVFLQETQELTALTARAERTLLAARRGGVEVQEGLTDIDNAVDAQIELEVLVHTFSADTSGAFVKRQREGMEFARAALAAGRMGLDELSSRRRGLYASLVFVGLVLIGLGWRIRQMSRRHVLTEGP